MSTHIIIFGFAVFSTLQTLRTLINGTRGDFLFHSICTSIQWALFYSSISKGL